MTVRYDISGMKFSLWTVLSHVHSGFWMCRCDCGNEKTVGSNTLRNGTSKSCGCVKQLKPTLYTLPYGIEVIGEYAPRGVNLYWRLRVRPHPFFPDAKISSGGISVRRNRAVMSSILGRAISENEHIHHKDEDRSNDDPSNLELLTADDHNKHHKTGSRHSTDSKARISSGLKRAHAEGRHAPPVIIHRDEKGRIKKCAA